MSYDGSSCKSYIKHATEKERLDNLAFTSFPEDYLPYTSSSYQREVAPPYLVWDEHNKKRKRRRKRSCCNTAALFAAIALIVIAIVAVIAISVYLGVVTNLFRSPVLSLSGKFRISKGDEFSEVLENATSFQFLVKAETYQAMVENVILTSSLEPAFISARIYAFRPGLLVFFRIYLDRRKLQLDDPSVIELVRDLLRTDSPVFGALILDKQSVEVDENEEWLSMPPSVDNRIAKVLNSTAQTKLQTTKKSTLLTRRPSSTSRIPVLPTTVSKTTTPVREVSRTGTGQVISTGPITSEEDNSKFSYGQWKPVPIEDSVSPSFGDQRTPPGRGSVRFLDEVAAPSHTHSPSPPPSVNVGVGSVRALEDPLHHVDPTPIRKLSVAEGPQRGEVASSIMSSVSLVIRKPNKTAVVGNGRLEVSGEGVSRNSHASYRFLEDVEENFTTDKTTLKDDIFSSSTFESGDFSSGEDVEFYSPISSTEEPDSKLAKTLMKSLVEYISENEHSDSSEVTADSTINSNENDSLKSNNSLITVYHLNRDLELISTSHPDEFSTTYVVSDYVSEVETSGESEQALATAENSVSPESNKNASALTDDLSFDSLETTQSTASNISLVNLTLESHTKEGHGFHQVRDPAVAATSIQSSSETSTVTGLATEQTQTPARDPPSTSASKEDSSLAFHSNESLSSIQGGVPKIVPQFQDLGYNPNEIDSNGEAVVEYDDFLDSEKFSIATSTDSEKEIIRHITTFPPTPMAVSLGKHPIFISNNCSEDELQCGSGECVDSGSRCNMRRDCRDNSDEKNCSCAQLLKVMGQSQKLCDGISDCKDLTDEINCPWCSAGEVSCPHTKFCINNSQVCDGENDCPMGTDEKYCVKLAESVSEAADLNYRSDGYLMVRKEGEWGKLCLDSVDDSEVLQLKIKELGRAVCSALTYRNVSKSVRVQDPDNEEGKYFVISNTLPSDSKKSSAIFEPSTCENKAVMRVSCDSLDCGYRPMGSGIRRRIVGGQSASSGSWPWQVALYKEGDFQCGAVLVSNIWLISAGHCFFSTQSAYWTARLGLLRRGSELVSPSEQIRRIEQIILHPDYVDKGFINDIALLRMDEPVPFSDFLRPLCLPLPNEDAGLWHGKQCSVVGWGKLYEIGHTFPDSLQEVRLPVVSTEECRKKIIFLSMYHITDNMFCAGYDRGGRDACLGDSGGPLMCQRDDGHWILLGVTSNGDGCGRPGRPGVYTKVTQYLPWISRIMNSEYRKPTNFSDTCEGVRCHLGRCIPPYKMCDSRWDCAEGLDEDNCAD